MDESETPPSPSRRNFLAKSGLVGAGLLTGFRINAENETFIPSSIHGIEVYGLINQINTVDKVRSFSDQINRNFFQTRDKAKLLDQLLRPDERNLQVTVRRSAYDRFLEEEPQTGCEFVRWIQWHTDLLNRIIQDAKPPVNLKVNLKRIIVVEDKVSSGWNEVTWATNQPDAVNLDTWWKGNFTPPLDIDCDWAVAKDYRGEEAYDYNFDSDKDKNIFFTPVKQRGGVDKYQFRPGNDSLTARKGVVDLGLIHEWSHYLLALPDEYLPNISSADTPSDIFNEFRVDTQYLHAPFMSAYLSCLLSQNIRLGLHGIRDQMSYDIWNKEFLANPKNAVELKIANCNQIQVYASRHPNFQHGPKVFPPTPDVSSNESDSVRVLNDLIGFAKDNNIYPLCYYLTCSDSQTGDRRELFVPNIPFIMDYFTGNKLPSLAIIFSGSTPKPGSTLYLNYIDKSDEAGFLAKLQSKHLTVYAQSKVGSVNFIWYTN